MIRQVRRLFIVLIAIALLQAIIIPSTHQSAETRVQVSGLSGPDLEFLDKLERTSWRFFWEETDPKTGLVKDRALADGGDKRTIASIAATGFGLTIICIADKNGYVKHQQAQARVLQTLKFIWERLPNEHGFFYHFIDMNTGARLWKCELSSIDTSLLLCGILTCRQYFDDPEIKRLAEAIYERVDWPWMLNGGKTFAMGWRPENGFIKSRWDKYSELMMIYLLAIGSPTHPVPADTWNAWERPQFDYEGVHYIGALAPIFVHQYSQAWFDFRGQHDQFTDYFKNSILATKAHYLFCLNLRDRFPWFSDKLWGITASDSAHGYTAWGGPPELGKLDGTIVPAAAGGSIPFLPEQSLTTLRYMREKYGLQIWRQYGFVDAFNPGTGWIDPDVIGIDLGITVLMAENARSGFVWNTFMKNQTMAQAMVKAGFKKNDAADYGRR